MRKKICAALKLCVLICLILLASLGIGIAGGVPIPFSDRRKQTTQVNTEWIEEGVEKSDLKESDNIF
ncbi:MAG: hypothetical protein AAGA77_19630 [Bacteroidota bacterium]